MITGIRFVTYCSPQGMKSPPYLQVKANSRWIDVEHVELKDHEDDTVDHGLAESFNLETLE